MMHHRGESNGNAQLSPNFLCRKPPKPLKRDAVCDILFIILLEKMVVNAENG